MNTIYKLLFAGLMCLGTLAASAQGPQPDAVAGATPAEPRHEQPHHGCMTHGMAKPVEFQSTKICYAPQMGAFVAVDSIECSVHLVKMVDGKLDTAASFTTDNTHKRHDLNKILRPVSVSVLGKYIVVLASASSDSAYVALLDQEMKPVARRAFRSPMYAMHFEHGQMFVVGRNPLGYDINVLPLRGGLEEFESGEALTHHYRVAQQAERIKQSDPVGVGLTAVAVAVVFLALVCIALILQGSGKLLMGMEDKEQKDKKQSKVKPVAEGSSAASNELYAAIAAAVHLYNDELHDEEDTVITIQKVEREWTPWNAKYYNMNHYFNNKK